MVRAAVENVEAGEVKQGASTITQQLVRNLYIDDPEDTIERKIIEAEMAREYEDEHTKSEILEEYLNTASYGTNDGKTAVGVQAASQVFFDKDVTDLNVGEAALLAGLPQAPTDYNPFLNPDGAERRRNQVLDAMAEQGYITFAEAQQNKRDGPRPRARLPLRVAHAAVLLRLRPAGADRQVRRRTPCATAGSRSIRRSIRGCRRSPSRRSRRTRSPAPPQALVSTDVDTGEIIAMASSESYEDSQFNLAAQGRRQPGSSFKPYALTAAVDQGIDPDSTYYSAPSSITLYPNGAYADPWNGLAAAAAAR